MNLEQLTENIKQQRAMISNLEAAINNLESAIAIRTNIDKAEYYNVFASAGEKVRDIVKAESFIDKCAQTVETAMFLLQSAGVHSTTLRRAV